MNVTLNVSNKIIIYIFLYRLSTYFTLLNLGIFLYIELFFKRRAIHSKNCHDHQALLIHMYVQIHPRNLRSLVHCTQPVNVCFPSFAIKYSKILPFTGKINISESTSVTSKNHGLILKIKQNNFKNIISPTALFFFNHYHEPCPSCTNSPV